MRLVFDTQSTIPISYFSIQTSVQLPGLFARFHQRQSFLASLSILAHGGAILAERFAQLNQPINVQGTSIQDARHIRNAFGEALEIRTGRNRGLVARRPNSGQLIGCDIVGCCTGLRSFGDFTIRCRFLGLFGRMRR